MISFNLVVDFKFNESDVYVFIADLPFNSATGCVSYAHPDLLQQAKKESDRWNERSWMVPHKMQTVLQEEQLWELRNVLYMVFAGCELVEQTAIQVMDHSWENDLEDFLMSRAIGGTSAVMH